jgi:hypothetical protein
LAYKKRKKIPIKPVITDDFYQLIHQIKTVEQNLEAKNEKTRVIKKKIDILKVKKKILLNSLKAKEKIINDRNKITVVI